MGDAHIRDLAAGHIPRAHSRRGHQQRDRGSVLGVDRGRRDMRRGQVTDHLGSRLREIPYVRNKDQNVQKGEAMKKCAACNGGETETRVVHEYLADLLGAPFQILLVDAVKEVWCVTCKKKLKTIIPDLEGLLHVAAQYRALTPRKLSGTEV